VKSTSWLAPSTYQAAAGDRARRRRAESGAAAGGGARRSRCRKASSATAASTTSISGAALTGGKHARIEYSPLTIQTDGGERHIVDYRVRVAGDGPLTFFLGPKEFDLLQRADTELTRTINLGMFGFLATPLLKALKWINEYIGNFGWSIILLTVLINLVLFPLRHKSAVSMRKMQQIQPQVKAIQDRYAKLKMTDPARQKMNQELMELYKAKGANPASGCLPMVLTFPVLFAFYAFLSQAIELRGAPDFLIHDLSRHDPYYVTPS
jgi:YidC/Oxa1 family membrane protein insertase